MFSHFFGSFLNFLEAQKYKATVPSTEYVNSVTFFLPCIVQLLKYLESPFSSMPGGGSSGPCAIFSTKTTILRLI